MAAIVASPTAARAAAAQTWSPFVLVTGLLMVGACAHADGLFAALGARVARFGASPRALLVALLGVVAVVSAVLNLDTAVAFLTPVVVLAARAQGLDEEPFLYGVLFMSNAASLLLPGSNLTNLLVVGGDVAGASFALRMLPVWLVAVGVTAVVVVVAYRSRLRAPTVAAPLPGIVRRGASSSTFAVGVAAVLLVFLPAPALPVLALGMALAAGAIRRGTVSTAVVRDAVDPLTLAGVFGIAVALGVLARGWSGPAQLLATANMAETALLGAIASVTLNNLPAAVLLASRPPAHATALLLGLKRRSQPGRQRLPVGADLVPRRQVDRRGAIRGPCHPARHRPRATHHRRRPGDVPALPCPMIVLHRVIG